MGELNQANTILPNNEYFMLYAFFNNPIPIIAPTTVCELETGTNGKEGSP